MQTFLPYPDFYESAIILDTKRHNKQILEAYQIWTVNDTYLTTGTKLAWFYHPATRMWRGYEQALLTYYNAMLSTWKTRGHKHSYIEIYVKNYTLPPWIGDPNFHISHQSNLIRKKPDHYKKYFQDVPDDLPYYWPA